MPTKLSRWGNSVGLRISRHVLESANLKIGDAVRMRVLDSGDVLITPVQSCNTPARQVEVVVKAETEAEILAGW